MSGNGQLWRAAGIIASQTAVLTALLFYFGWARANAAFGYFGVDVSLLGFSTSDYLLRSVNPAFRPLLLTGLVAVLATGVHQGLAAAAAHGGDRVPGWVRRIPVVASGVGVVLAAIGLSGIVAPHLGSELGVWLPLSLATGFALLAYAELSWPRFRAGGADAARHPARQLRSFLLVGLALMALFWTVALYADQTGTELARSITRHLASRTEVVLYAKERLMLTGPGVKVADIDQADSKYRYRYRGLRLLVRSQDRYVLLPVGWTRGRDSAYVLRDDADVRLEFAAHR
jgi:hypothetical protein